MSILTRRDCVLLVHVQIHNSIAVGGDILALLRVVNLNEKLQFAGIRAMALSPWSNQEDIFPGIAVDLASLSAILTIKQYILASRPDACLNIDNATCIFAAR